MPCPVLLGEGYYAERTSKQTVEILKRRGKVLDSQVDSLKAMMKDLQAEASFFDTTASEAAEGLCRDKGKNMGRKICLKGHLNQVGLLKQDSSRLSEADNLKDEDERICPYYVQDKELNKGTSPDISTSFPNIVSNMSLKSSEEAFVTIESLLPSSNFKLSMSMTSCSGSKRVPLSKFRLQLASETTGIGAQKRLVSQKTLHTQKVGLLLFWSGDDNLIFVCHEIGMAGVCTVNTPNVRKCTGLTVQAALEDAKPRTKSLATNVNVEANSAEKALVLPKEDNVATAPLSIQEISAQASEAEFDRYRIGVIQFMSTRHNQNRIPSLTFAFTESIIEHNYNLQTDQQEQIRNTSKPSGSQSSKPVSRFKMQRKKKLDLSPYFANPTIDCNFNYLPLRQGPLSGSKAGGDDDFR
ncbi:hypothetical protein CUMW_239150 [Citrus unshiu]|uniref:Uncharacterized protein n=1 Tax=Citrus unshiu TaxID=55188 RepID=A0A2H5QKL5_CITUN|nr:hypothetical protein CUMW_239150 [Citrus unshiu]